MSLPLGQRRALRGIERDLARSDPDLTRLFSFIGLTSTQEIPAAEKIRSRPFRLLARLGQQENRRVHSRVRVSENDIRTVGRNGEGGELLYGARYGSCTTRRPETPPG